MGIHLGDLLLKQPLKEEARRAAEDTDGKAAIDIKAFRKDLGLRREITENSYSYRIANHTSMERGQKSRDAKRTGMRALRTRG